MKSKYFLIIICLIILSPKVFCQESIGNVSLDIKNNKLIIKYTIENDLTFREKFKNNQNDDLYYNPQDIYKNSILIGIKIETKNGEKIKPKKVNGDVNRVSIENKKNKIICIFDKNTLNLLNYNLIVTVFNKNNPDEFCSSESVRTLIKEQSQFPPILSVSDIKFVDANNNNFIDSEEECFISFIMTNKGKGAARNIYVDIEDNSTTKELNFDKKLNIDNIPANEKQVVNIPIKGTLDLTSGKANIKVSFNEAYGFQPDPFEIYIETKELIKPNMKVVDYVFLSEDGKIRRGLPVQLKVLVQNIGKGTAEDVSVNFQYPSANVFPNSQKEFILGIFQPGETKEVVFEFIANKLYSETFIPINTEIVEKYGLFSENKKVFATIDEKFSTNTSINIVSVGNPIEDKINIPIASLTPEVDINIPITDKINENRYALIIGNKDYTKYQTNLNSESNVDFADRDAEIFAEYCEKTLGMPKENIFLLKDAISSQMNREIEKLSRLAFYSNGKAELIFYYAGHGFPDEKTKESYIMPVDISGSDVTSGIKLSYLYKKLTENPVKSATVFLDACFSGGGRNQGLLAARGVRIQPKENLVQGNLVVFSASTGEQSSLPYKEKQHGMFTYFLLKKLQESKGNVTYDELSNYIKTEVQLNSVKINSKDQNPQTLTSPSLSDEWKMWNLK